MNDLKQDAQKVFLKEEAAAKGWWAAHRLTVFVGTALLVAGFILGKLL